MWRCSPVRPPYKISPLPPYRVSYARRGAFLRAFFWTGPARRGYNATSGLFCGRPFCVLHLYKERGFNAMELRLPIPPEQLTRAERSILDFINTNTDAFLFLSIGQLAERLGISRSAISMYERGEREPDTTTMEAIAALFGVDMNYLYGMPTVTFDDFTYALHNESKDLTEENKQKLLEMARLFKLAQQHGSGN